MTDIEQTLRAIVRRRRGNRHELIVDALVLLGAKRSGMSLRLREIGIPFQTDRFQPDAFEFRLDERVLVLHEVVITNPIDDEKRRRIGVLGEVLAAIGWSIELIVYNRHGEVQ